MTAKLHSPERLAEIEGNFARNCVCEWRGVLWATKLGADRDYVAHVAREAAEACGRVLASVEFIEGFGSLNCVEAQAPPNPWHRDK
jgi:hypothetical protein